MRGLRLAFPWCGDLNDHPTIELGLTQRQYAAIHLRVPDSGTEWLDDMIRKAMRNELTAQALAGMMASLNHSVPTFRPEDAAYVYAVADAMLAAAGESAEG